MTARPQSAMAASDAARKGTQTPRLRPGRGRPGPLHSRRWARQEPGPGRPAARGRAGGDVSARRAPRRAAGEPSARPGFVDRKLPAPARTAHSQLQEPPPCLPAPSAPPPPRPSAPPARLPCRPSPRVSPGRSDLASHHCRTRARWADRVGRQQSRAHHRDPAAPSAPARVPCPPPRPPRVPPATRCKSPPPPRPGLAGSAMACMQCEQTENGEPARRPTAA